MELAEAQELREAQCPSVRGGHETTGARIFFAPLGN